MSNTIVLYKSKYGATKKYAEWLQEEISCDILDVSLAKAQEVQKYDVIILGGGIYASGIAGISFLKKNISEFQDKRMAVFAVGASPYDEAAMGEIKARNMKDELKDIPCFYCRGAWDEEKMSFKDRTLCNLLKKSVAKKDPSTYEPWMAALMQTIGKNCDWTDKASLEPLLEFIRR